MEWTLGITNGFSLVTTLGSIFIIAIFLSLFIPLIIAVPDDEAKMGRYFTLCFIGSFFVAYYACAYLVSLEINEISYKNLQEKIEPYMDDKKIQELLIESKKDGEISSAERDHLYHRVNQIESLKEKKQVAQDGEIAKKQLVGK